jgi:segregation and condensation protein B
MTMSNEHADLNEPISPEPEPASTGAEPIAETEGADPTTTEAEHGVAETSVAEATMDVAELKRALEAVLLAANEPMPLAELRRVFDGEFSVDILRNLLEELRAEWAERSVELAIVASGYRFRVKPAFQKYLDRLSNEKPPKYSRAVLETLAIIAYRQPVTRADIEDIRGVAVSPHILKTLEDRGWIDEIGHKDAPGRPALFATTKHFLDDLNLRSLEELPPLHELQATLDMSQAGAALHAGGETLALPGVGTGVQERVVPEDAGAADVDARESNPHDAIAEANPQSTDGGASVDAPSHNNDEQPVVGEHSNDDRDKNKDEDEGRPS